MRKQFGLSLVYGGLALCALGILLLNGPLYVPLNGEWNNEFMQWGIRQGRWGIRLALYAGRAAMYGAPFLIGGACLLSGMLMLRGTRAAEQRVRELAAAPRALNAGDETSTADAPVAAPPERVSTRAF